MQQDEAKSEKVVLRPDSFGRQVEQERRLVAVAQLVSVAPHVERRFAPLAATAGRNERRNRNRSTPHASV